MKRLSRFSVALLVLTLVAFGAQGAIPPVFDAKKEEHAIRELDTKWAETVTKKNIEIALRLYAPDVIVLDPDAPARRGLEAVRASWTDLLKMPGITIAIRPGKIEFSAAGDLATDFGRFDLEFDGPNGRVKMVNKYLTIWRKLDGQWKVAYDCWNTNAPPPP